MSDDTPPEVVDTPAALAGLCAALEAQSWVALDTEFLRERTYHPRLCLLQVATPERVALVDPLALPSLEPLLEVLYRPELRKVLHAAAQDLEVLARLRDTLPPNLFDTQLAAPLLGYREQIGYGELVEAMLGVQLGKGHARTDWSRRPLDPEQIAYAADDVRYLARLYPVLHDALERRGRLAWLAPDLAALEDVTRFRQDPEDAWRRLRGASRLRPRQRGVLQALAAWRERTAQAQDRPRGWILKDDVLLDLARTMPRDLAGLGRLRGLPPATVRHHGDALLAAIAAGREAPAPSLPESPGRDLEPAAQVLVDLLGVVARHRALAEDLDPGMLAPRRHLERLVAGDPQSPMLQGWRREVVGTELQAVLRGERQVAVRDGALALTEVPAGG
jgi:ribonuclease D